MKELPTIDNSVSPVNNKKLDKNTSDFTLKNLRKFD